MSAFTWDAGSVERLLQAHHEGGRRAALRAFPDLRPAQVFCALRRYVDRQPGDPVPLLPRDEIRERIAEMSYDLFIERIHGLVTWSPLRTRAHGE